MRWMTRMGGRRERESFLEVLRAFLQRGQNLRAGSAGSNEGVEATDHASSLSRISSRTNEEMQSCRVTLEIPRPEGTGIERGMKVCENGRQRRNPRRNPKTHVVGRRSLHARLVSERSHPANKQRTFEHVKHFIWFLNCPWKHWTTKLSFLLR